MNQAIDLVLGGLTEEEAEALQEVARDCEERAKCAVEEMIEAIFRAVSAVGTHDLETLDNLRKELEECEKGRCDRRRKMERSRAQAVEQRYRAEIRRAEQVRFYRRIYKPPESKNRRNEHETRKSCSNIAVL